MDLRRKQNRTGNLVTWLVGGALLAALAIGVSLGPKEKPQAAQSTGSAAQQQEQAKGGPKIYEGPMPGFEGVELPEDPQVLYYRLNPEPLFAGDGSGGTVFIENPAENLYDMQVDYELPNGKVVYTSPVLHPGQYVAEGTLKQKLGGGRYDINVRLYAMEEGAIVGVVETPVRLIIED